MTLCYIVYILNGWPLNRSNSASLRKQTVKGNFFFSVLPSSGRSLALAPTLSITLHPQPSSSISHTYFSFFYLILFFLFSFILIFLFLPTLSSFFSFFSSAPSFG